MSSLAWVAALACAGEVSPWATTDDDVVSARLERLLGSYSENACREWVPSDHFLDSVASSAVPDHPDVWTGGSFVLDELSGVGFGGCGMYSLKSGAGWFDRRWRSKERGCFVVDFFVRLWCWRCRCDPNARKLRARARQGETH